LVLRLACGYTIFVGQPEYSLDDLYPDRQSILHYIAWAAANGFSGIELGSRSLRHFTQTFDAKFARQVSETITTSSIEVAQLMCGFIVRSVMTSSRKDATEMLDSLFDRATLMSCKVVASSASVIPNISTIPNAIYPEAPPSRIHLSSGFSWAGTWEDYIDALKFCVTSAESHGLKFALEARPREMVSTTDGLLSLFKEVGSSNLGALVDTAHLFVHREYIPLSLHKLGKKIFAVHLTDSDGLIEHHWAPGEGKIDWAEVLNAFSAIGYRDLLTVELFPLMRNPDEEFLQGKAFLEGII
jgi:sugar phosphate isomerase/epimerase